MAITSGHPDLGVAIQATIIQEVLRHRRMIAPAGSLTLYETL
jgi:hypothetical protein